MAGWYGNKGWAEKSKGPLAAEALWGTWPQREVG